MLQLPNYNLLKNTQEHISKKLNNDRMIKAQAGFVLSTLIQKSCGKANHKYIFSAAKMSNFDSSAGNRDTEYGS